VRGRCRLTGTVRLTYFRRNPFRSLGLALALPLALGAAETNAPKTFRCAGTVVDAEGRPVAGAVIESYQYGARGPFVLDELELKHRVTAATNGAFDLQLTRASTVLLARKPGLAPTWRQWTPVRDTEERLVLTPTTVLAGVVVDEAAKPVPDAEVWVGKACIEVSLGEGRRSYSYLSGKLARSCFATRTGADGKFRIEGFPTNAVADLAVGKPGKVLRELERDSISPDTMRCRAGQQDIKLVLDPGSTIEGRVVTADTDKPVADVWLSLEYDRPGVLRSVEPVRSGADGTFRFADIGGGSYHIRTSFGTNAVPEWVADAVPASVEAGQTARDVKVVAAKGGFLEVTVLGKADRKPIAQGGVSVYKQAYRNTAATDTNGLAILRLPPGEYQLQAYKQGWRSIEEPLTATIEAGRTNRVEVELSPPTKVTGTVRDPEGKPVSGLRVKVFPEYRANLGELKTDADGRFEFTWDPARYGRSGEPMCVIARDEKRKLVAAEDLDEETTTLDLRLEPGWIVTGRVEDPDGKPLTNASVTVFLWAGNSGSSFDKALTTDAQGRFEVAGLPPDRRYSANATAKGYGASSQQAEGDETETNRIELPPFVLRVADRPLAGRVVDEDEKSVAGAYVHSYGDGQPNESVRTDQQGRFVFAGVCEGTVRLSGSHQNSYGNTSAEAGDTNVVLTLGSRSSSVRSPPKRPSLAGKSLPDLGTVGLTTNAVPAGRPVLLCLFDFEQRPSRRWVRLLAEQHESLRNKGLTVVAVQAAVTEANSLRVWKDSNPLPFLVGSVPEKSEKSRWASGVESLPWLILTDKQGRVAAEGFHLDELETKLGALPK